MYIIFFKVFFSYILGDDYTQGDVLDQVVQCPTNSFRLKECVAPPTVSPSQFPSKSPSTSLPTVLPSPSPHTSVPTAVPSTSTPSTSPTKNPTARLPCERAKESIHLSNFTRVIKIQIFLFW